MNFRDDDALERLAEIHDELEEIIREAGARDGQDYLRDMRIRARLIGERYYLNITCYRSNVPDASVVYAPLKCMLTPWYKTLDRDGILVWECGVEVNKP